MTLVIAGYSYGVFEQESIYFASDSNITQNNVVMVNGFKKVIEVPIKMQGLSFSGEWFNDYYHKSKNDAVCAIAFAGSTLVAQHMINSIKNHLSELYPSYRNGKYILAMSCEGSKQLRNGDYDESMFLPRHINSLINADYISDVVEHSINAVLDKARKHTSMRNHFGAYQAEFLLGIQCPQDRKYYLYKYEIVEDPILEAVVKKTVIRRNAIAMIGSGKFKQDYFEKVVFKEAFDNRIFTKNDFQISSLTHEYNSFFGTHGFVYAGKRVFKLLNEVIDYENSTRSNIIGKPSGLFELQDGILKRVGFER